MAHWQIFCRPGLKCVLMAAFVLPLASCGGGGSGSSGGGSGALSWVAPSQRQDGAALQLSEIKSYRVYYGESTGVYSGQIDINDPTSTAEKLNGIPSGTYFVVMTTVDIDGRESVYSSEVEIKI